MNITRKKEYYVDDLASGESITYHPNGKSE